MKIQHECAEVRVKGDSSYTQRLEAEDLLGGKFVWTDTFAKQGGQWMVVASQITPVLEK